MSEAETTEEEVENYDYILTGEEMQATAIEILRLQADNFRSLAFAETQLGAGNPTKTAMFRWGAGELENLAGVIGKLGLTEVRTRPVGTYEDFEDEDDDLNDADFDLALEYGELMADYDLLSDAHATALVRIAELEAGSDATTEAPDTVPTEDTGDTESAPDSEGDTTAEAPEEPVGEQQGDSEIVKRGPGRPRKES